MTDEILINDAARRREIWREAVASSARGEPPERLFARLQTATPEGLTWQALAVEARGSQERGRPTRVRADAPVAALQADSGALGPRGLPVTDPLAASLLGLDAWQPSPHADHSGLVVGLGETVAEAGADAVLDLAVALGAGAQMILDRVAGGEAFAALAAQSRLRFAIGRSVWTEVARLRAARRCWARLLRVLAARLGADPDEAHVPVSIDALQARRAMTLVDPKTNILRGTTAAFAAVVGGADRVLVRPFDDRDGEGGSALARRVARNTLRVLHHEAALDDAIDPAAGSFALEGLTDELAREAWRLLGDIDRDGGVVASLRRGVARDRLVAARTSLRRDVATRRRPMTGVSTTPALADAPSMAARSSVAVDTTPSLGATGDRDEDPLRFFDEAAVWHALRAASDATLAEAGHRPTCLLALFGRGAAASARADWTRHALHAVGVATLDWRPDERATPPGTAHLACVCGPDDERGAFLGAHGAAVAATGARSLAVAGRPVDGESADVACGLPIVTWLRVGEDLAAAGARLQRIAAGGAA